MAETTMHCANPGCGKAIRICPEGGNCDFPVKFVHVFTGLHPCTEEGQVCASPAYTDADSAPAGFIVLRADGPSGLLSRKTATERAVAGNRRAGLGGRKDLYVVAEVRIIGEHSE
jgi:hypothetical protein